MHKMEPRYFYSLIFLLFFPFQQVAGIPEEKLIEAHGSFASASCTLCGRRHDAARVKKAIVTGEVPIMCEGNRCKVIIYFVSGALYNINH